MPDMTEVIPDLFDRILRLKRSPVFSEVNTETLRVVARELVEETYMPGERVCDINDQGDQMYIIETGRIGISINEDPGKKEFVAVLHEGDCFGEMGMLDDLPRSATAHVIDKTHLLVLEKACLRSLISKFPELALGILRSMSLRLREVNKLIKS
jgi:CRP/FNR family cyclic AMP-dependent transcriptional regulator